MNTTTDTANIAPLMSTADPSRHHDALVQVSLHDIGRKLGFLHKLPER